MSMISSTELDRHNLTNTAVLSQEGVSIWLDDLSREQIDSGSLAELIKNRNVVGVTTNPTIFAAALANGEAYREQVALLAKTHLSVEEATIELVTTDVARACDIFDGLYAATNGVDGRVSIEVDPRLAHDTTATIEQARELAAKVGQHNVLVKIPATVDGLAAITDVIGDGISVNVTLIFSLDRYRQVIDAYLSGLEKARAAGIDLARIHSVASFFVSRVDTEIDKRLETIGTAGAAGLRSRAAIANARLAYQVFEKEFASDRARALLEAGANLQRPLWASTGVKDPALPATYYVDELVAPNTVNTMPAKTLEAAFHHAQLRGNTIAGTYEDARATLDELAAAGIVYDDVTATLEREGVAKFIASWEELLATVETALQSAR